MRAFSKWTKWQIGLVITFIVVYLFQEVKDSPEFLKAVREAATLKLNSTPKVTSNLIESTPRERLNARGSEKMERRGSSRETLNSSGGSTMTQPHTRSHAS